MSDAKLATTPQPPYYAVIFASLRTKQDDEGYAAAAERMAQLASEQPGYLGIESGWQEGFALAVSYWASLEAIDAWRRNARHLIAKDKGKSAWFTKYRTRIAKVEQVY